MRLFGTVNGTIDRRDRAAWLSGIFDRAFFLPSQLPREHELAAAIVDALNTAEAETFPLDFTAERRHLVRFDTKQLATLRVAVAPIGKTARRVARGVWLEEHTIGVGIQQRVESGDAEEAAEQLDQLARLTEAIERHLQTDALRELAGIGDAVGGAVLVDIDRNPIAEPADLAERKYFAQVRLTFHIERESSFAFIEPPAADESLAGEHQLADAVAAALNTAEAGTFGQDFTANRYHLVRFDTLQLGTLRVSVAPLAKPARPTARFVWTEQHSIGLAVQWKLEHADQLAQCDRLALLSQQVEDYLQADDLSELAGGQLLTIDRDPIADPEALMEREYRAVLRLTYQRDCDTN